MNARCRTCGGVNEIHPGAEMVSCSYCGSALVIEAEEGPERLIIPHERRDERAEDAIQSFLAAHGGRLATGITTHFAYVPYFIVEDASGSVQTVAASAFKVPGGVPLPPAGRYKFFDEKLAGGERVISALEPLKGTMKIIFIPVYRLNYHAGASEDEAAVVGGSWQVLSHELPLSRPRPIHVASVLAAAALFVGYLLLGSFVHNLIGRIAVIAAASSAGYFAFFLHERMMKR